MDITQEDIGSLNAVIKVKIVPADYQVKYDAAIKKHQKKASMPGFRPGKVPATLIKKMYGKHILVEELNDILSETLHKYISENRIDILGSPLPKENGHHDFENQTEFEFQYEIGLAPKLNVELSSKDTYSYQTVRVDEALIDKHSDHFRRNYGQVIHPEVSEEKDVLVGDFVEVDKDGNIVPGGFFKTTLFSPEKILNPQNKSKLIGLKQEDKVILDNLSEEASYFFETLELNEEQLKNLVLQFRVRSMSRIIQAELNQELFDKIYGPDKVNSAEEFRNKIKEELAVVYITDSDQKFMNEVMDSLLKKYNLSLPDDFLKRYLVATSKEKLTYEQADKDFHSYADSIKWQLIETNILKTYKIVVTNEEAERFVTDIVKMNFAKRGQINVSEEDLKATVKKVMEDEKQMKSAYDRLYNQKMIDLFKNTFTLEKQEVPYDEFFKNPKS